MDEISQLYARKGELVTQIELLQSQLRFINEKLAEILNRVRQEEQKPVQEGES